MATKQFTGFSEDQMKRIAQKLGYSGPMNKFNEFLASNPGSQRAFSGLEAKAKMKFAQGGSVRKYQVGGFEDGRIGGFEVGRGGIKPGVITGPEFTFQTQPSRRGPLPGQPYQPPIPMDGQNIMSAALMQPSAVFDGNQTLQTAATQTQRPVAGTVKLPTEPVPTQQPYGPMLDPTTGKPIQQEVMRAPENDFERFGVDLSKFNTYSNKVAGKKSTGGTLTYEVGQDQKGIYGNTSAMTGTNANTVRAMLRIFDQYKAKSGNKNITPKIQVSYPRNSNEFDLKVDGKSVGKFTNTKEGMQEAGQALLGQFNEQYGALEAQEMIGTGEFQQVVPTMADLSAQRMYQPGLPPGGAVTATGINVQDDQLIKAGTGQLSGDVTAQVQETGPAAQATAATQPATATVQASQVAGATDRVLAETQAAQGQVSKGALVNAAQGKLSAGAIAQAPEFDNQYMQKVVPGEREVSDSELISAATEEVAPQAEAAQMSAPVGVTAEQTAVKSEELVNAAQISEAKMAQATAATAAGLDPAAVAQAEQLDGFSVDAGTLAAFKEGNVEAQSTVQGQLASLMKQFDDGTPNWAAGAIRQANAVMASRGLGGSSMAGAAIFQAAMESALPIAQQDAQAFLQMEMQNTSLRTQVSLANAAAQQGVELQNLNNRQQVALQNSVNSFELQTQNLSNTQQTILANAQIRAGLQAQNLTNQQQAAIANAARFAEVNDVNLNNRQQAALQNSAQALQADLANLSNRQQTALANAQLQAALQGKNLDNRQQAAILNAERFAEANNMTFTAAQQAQLQNSELMKSIGLANLNAEQATVLQNAANLAQMDMANLNNRQQAAVQNAQAFLQMDMANLSNEQQTTMFKAQSRTQALLSDQAAENAARQFNASSENQANQFFANMKTQVSQFNATQKNAMAQFNAEEANAMERFNAEVQNQRDQFNAQNQLVVAQSNAQWRRDVATSNTAAINAANQLNAQAVLDISNQAYANMWQAYEDQMEYAWQSTENERDRVNDLVMTKLSADASKSIAELRADAQASSSLGKFATYAVFGSGGILSRL